MVKMMLDTGGVRMMGSIITLKSLKRTQDTLPTVLTAMLSQVKFLLNITCELPLQRLILLNVKKVTLGRIRRERCLYRILREDLSRKFRVEKRARRRKGRNNRKMVTLSFRATSDGLS